MNKARRWIAHRLAELAAIIYPSCGKPETWSCERWYVGDTVVIFGRGKGYSLEEIEAFEDRLWTQRKRLL